MSIAIVDFYKTKENRKTWVMTEAISIEPEVFVVYVFSTHFISLDILPPVFLSNLCTTVFSDLRSSYSV
jgi:hypothetical protein